MIRHGAIGAAHASQRERPDCNGFLHRNIEIAQSARTRVARRDVLDAPEHAVDTLSRAIPVAENDTGRTRRPVSGTTQRLRQCSSSSSAAA
jgi:hypothetical protein